jgi:RNA polymerase sigma-70 factor (ECF subfamily)
VVDTEELDPLDVADDRETHVWSLTRRERAALQGMMEVVSVPPFERFYEAHRGEVLAFLVRRLGRDRAEDAFQETFLRALRGYPKLRHGEHLRAWALTIASRVVADAARRRQPPPPQGEPAATDERPAYAQLEHLADELPPKERAAVVLRYGYDLPYEEIADALDSTPDAARQAASSGVRRLRRKELP